MSENPSFPNSPEVQHSQPDSFPNDDSERKTGKFENFFLKVLRAKTFLIVLALTCIITLLGNLMDSGLLTAMCVLVGIFLVPVFSRELRQDSSILLVYWFVVALHQSVAFINVYFFETLGADFDANHFQELSEEYAEYGEWGFKFGYQLYVQMLGTIYRWVGTSHLLGAQLSILAFALSCIVLLKLMRLLEVIKYRSHSLFAFGALPTMVFLGSITLRESYQVLFFMGAVYFGFKMLIKDGFNSYIIPFFLSVFAMVASHRGLIGYGMFIIPLFFIWSLRPATRRGNIKKLRLAAFIVAPLTILGLLFLATTLLGLGMYSDIFSENWLEKIAAVRVGPILTPSRATYGVYLDLSSITMTVFTGLKLYYYYLFAPFPWQVDGFKDMYAAMESLFRMILICFSIKQFYVAVGLQKRLIGFLLILFFSITLLFGIGTANVGTATRHHMLDWWIIVIIGIPALMTTLSSFRNRFVNFRFKRL